MGIFFDDDDEEEQRSSIFFDEYKPPSYETPSLFKATVQDVAASRVKQALESPMPMEQGAAHMAMMPRNLLGIANYLTDDRYETLVGLEDKLAGYGLPTYEEARRRPEETKRIRRDVRESALQDADGFLDKAKVYGTEIGTEILATAPEALLSGGGLGAAVKSIPWIARLAKTSPRLAGALAGGGATAVEGMAEEAWLSQGLSAEERSKRALGGVIGGGVFGAVGGAVGSHFFRAAADDQAAEAGAKAVNEWFGPRSGFSEDLEAARVKSANVPETLEQMAGVEMSMARSAAEKAGLDSRDVHEALFDTAKMKALPDDVRPYAQSARKILDDESLRLISPGGKVWDQIETRAASVADARNRKLEGTFDVEGNYVDSVDVREDFRELAEDALTFGSFEDTLADLDTGAEQTLFKLSTLEETIKTNQGEYAHRVYERFMDPDFAQNRFRQIDSIKEGNVPAGMEPEVANNLVRAYDDMMEMLGQGADGESREIWDETMGRAKLFDLMESSSPTGMALGKPRAGSKIPQTKWGELKRRTLRGEGDEERVNFEAALRILYGEDVDPQRQLLRSIKRISADQQGYEFKKLLVSEYRKNPNYSTERVEGVFDFEVPGLRESGVRPLFANTRAAADELADSGSKFDGGVIDAMNYSSKASATVLNPVTHIRNIMANPAFLAFSGLNPFSVLNPKDKFGNFRKYKSMLRLLDENPGSKLLEIDPKQLVEMKDAMKKMMDRGLIENVDTNDLDRFITDIVNQRKLGKGSRVAEAIGKFTETLTNAKWLGKPAKRYQNEDFFFKAMGYVAEKKRLVDTGVFTAEDVETLTMSSLENMLPTYSRLSKVTERARRLQAVAPFVNFYSELIRTAKKGVETAFTQTFQPDKYLFSVLGHVGDEAQQAAIKKIGMKRYAGIAATIATPYAMKAAYEKTFGTEMSEEEDAASRSFMPPWSKGNPVIYLSKEDGKHTYLDLGYLFPHASLYEPSVLAQPFMSPQIPVSEAMNAYRDLQKVDQLTPEQQLKVLIKRGHRAFSPGFIKYFERIMKGVAHDTESEALNAVFPGTTRYGKEFSTIKEAAAMFGRPTTQNVAEGIKWKGIEFDSAYGQVRKLVKDQRNNPARLTVAMQEAEQEFLIASERMIGYIDDAFALGMTDPQIRTALQEGGVNKGQVDTLMKGYIPQLEFKF